MVCNNIVTRICLCEPHLLSAQFSHVMPKNFLALFFARDSLTKYSYIGKRCWMQKRLVSYMSCMMYRLTPPAATDDKIAYYSPCRYGCNEGHTVVCSAVSRLVSG